MHLHEACVPATMHSEHDGTGKGRRQAEGSCVCSVCCCCITSVCVYACVCLSVQGMNFLVGLLLLAVERDCLRCFWLLLVLLEKVRG